MIFGLIMMFLFGGIVVKLILNAGQSTDRKEMKKNTPQMVFGTLFFGVGCYIVLLEYNLMTNSTYVEGTTIEFCRAGKGGKGIEFEYYLDGHRYTNCNTYKDLNQIKVPGGKFKVRVSEFAPSIGRIDFRRPLSKDSKNY